MASISNNINLRSRFWSNRVYYLMLVPAIILIFIFCYIPMYGIIIAFQDYRIGNGILGSQWVGLKHFRILFGSATFYQIFRNTVLISLYKFIAINTIPLLLALMMNEVYHRKFKRVIQTVSYLPYFLSWVVVGGIVIEVLSPERGLVNSLIQLFGGKSIYFITQPEWFRAVLVASDAWKNAGWSSILYLATLSSIDPQLYDAAKIDGANRLQQVKHITLPALYSVVIILMILSLGQIMNAGYEQVLNLYSPLVYNVGDIFDTYIYRIGITGNNQQVPDYSLSTAVGLFKNVIGFFLVLSTNMISKKISDYGVW